MVFSLNPVIEATVWAVGLRLDLVKGFTELKVKFTLSSVPFFTISKSFLPSHQATERIFFIKLSADYTVYNLKMLDKAVGKTYNNSRKVVRMTEQPKQVIQYTIKNA